MSKEAETSDEQTSATEELHPAPSMFWALIPVGLIALYAFFSR